MKLDLDKLLNQLVVTALTLFIAVILLLAAFVLRHLWLQQHIANLSYDVQVRLDDLEETHEEINRELVEIRATPDDTQTIDNWEDISEALEMVDAQLDSIEEDMIEVALVMESQSETTTLSTEMHAARQGHQDLADQVFMIFGILISITSIVIAILLGAAMKIQQIEHTGFTKPDTNDSHGDYFIS